MKNGKRPTLIQKIELKEHGLNPANWLVVKNCVEGLEVVHRQSGNIRIIERRSGK